ncbi:MAG TPA: Mur ligase family protein, partial [Sediminibacterium sp.]|nr:Mur ligase family protein [Sediminibacterium sp.]
MRYPLSDIAGILQVKGVFPETLFIDQLLTDSRKLLFPERTLFFALEGPRRSGISYVAELYARGVRCFVVNQTASLPDLPGMYCLRVPDVLEALQQLAAWHRSKFRIPVIGITGSSGKTMVKEWLYQLLQTDEAIIRSPRSYNSQIGVPLSVWQMESAYRLAIFEAGISMPGEMIKLRAIIQP